MRKSLFFILSLSLILVACEKDDSNSSVADQNEYALESTSQESFTYNLVSIDGSAEITEHVSLNTSARSESPLNDQYRDDSFLSGAKGEFQTQTRVTANFWALDEGRGAQGVLYSEGNLELEINLSCLIINANASVIGGEVTRTGAGAEALGIRPEAYVYFKVIDNDDEREGSSDQISHNLLVVNPDEASCDRVAQADLEEEIRWNMTDIASGDIAVFSGGR